MSFVPSFFKFTLLLICGHKYFSFYLNDKKLCVSIFLDPKFKFKFQRNDMGNTIKNGFYIYFLLKQNQDTLLEALLRVKKIKVKVKLSFSSLFDELASNKPTVRNRNLEQV